MSDRVNRLFSPERLRGRWAGTEATEEPKAQLPVVNATKEEVVHRLKVLEQEMSSDLRKPSGPALTHLLIRLRELIDERFVEENATDTDGAPGTDNATDTDGAPGTDSATSEGPSGVKRERALILAEMESTLNAIEDLMEASRYSRFTS